MTGVVYFICNSKEKKTDPPGEYTGKFKERADPNKLEFNHFNFVFVKKFGLEWVNDGQKSVSEKDDDEEDEEEDDEHMNLTVKQWDHSAFGDDPNKNCGACLRCDIRARDFTNCQYVVIVISSHGKEDQEPMIIMSDGHVLLLSDIVNALSDTGCPALVGKTRIIVIQACRGTEMDKGATVLVQTDKPGNSPSPADIPPARPERVVDVEPPEDFLIVFSSPSGFAAIKDKKLKSWMLADLATIMKQKEQSGVAQVNFLQILSEANNLVCQRVGHRKEKDKIDAAGKAVIGEYKSTMCIYHRLTEQPVFNIHRKKKHH